MTTDVKILIADYLRTHRRLVVPQLGAFIVKTPGEEVLFSELFKRDDGVLRGLLTADGANEIEAAGAVDRLIFDLRHAVQNGDGYLIAGLGTFAAGEHGSLIFTYDPQAGVVAETDTESQSGSDAEAAASDVPVSDAGAASGEDGSIVSDTIERDRKTQYGPDPYVKGLTYGRPVKTTAPYTFVGSKPSRRIDTFIIVAIVAALLAVGVIVFGLVADRQAKQMQTELLEEVSAAGAATDSAME